MLDRIKKRQWDGLKDFVESIEVTGASQRQMILINGILEDPIFMRWVTKNVRNFSDFLQLSSDEIAAVVRSSEAMISVMAKALPLRDENDIQNFAPIFPNFFGKLRDEVSYLKDVPSAERESAQYFIIRTVRKLQKEEQIAGFKWHLPPQDVFFEKNTKKEGMISITFDDGTIAAEGEILKSNRIGIWRHFYDNGRILAEGSYQEGIKTGAWKFYFGNGEKRSEGRYLNDLRHGKWSEWDRDGNVKVTDWVEGKKTSN
jgi:hypothetical protein